MAQPPIVPRRLLLAGLALSAAVAGMAGAAGAQSYYYDDEDEPYPRGYYERYAPRPPAPLPPRARGQIAARDLGLAQIDRTVRTRSSYIVDGVSPRGIRERLIFDSASGELVDRIELPGASPRQRTARIDPRDDDGPAPRVVPRPPQRPAALKPPAQASAPATVTPPSAIVPPAAPGAMKPADTAPARTPPAQASAPATTPPAPETPQVDPSTPETGIRKPRIVGPDIFRDQQQAQPEPQSPLAKADPSGISVPPVELPPVRIEGMTTGEPQAAEPKPATPEVPVAPLE